MLLIWRCIPFCMDGCVGRSEELAFLNDLWAKAPMSCAVCGRRHLGKTTLLKEFVKDKDHIYITGTAGLRSDNLEEINRALGTFSGKKEKITDIIDLFPRIKQICGKRKVAVIIDRLSDLASNFEEINAYIRSFMNREMGSTKIFLVVCDNDNSIFGRFYYTLELKPMSYLDCKGFHPGYTDLQQLQAFAMLGGTPAYHHILGDRDPIDVLRNEMFDHMSVFSLEAESMVSSEVFSLDGCTKVLAAMSRGAEGIREISSRTQMASSYCSKLVEEMEHKGLLQKEVSSGISRRAVYTINSNILRFYHQVIYRYTHMVEFESASDAFAAAEMDIAMYMERGFKTVCMDYVAQNYEYKFIGKLRRKDDTVDDVIDFVASVNIDGKPRTMVARCRLSGNPVGKPDLDELVARAKKVDGSSKMYVLFSGSGFSQDLVKAVQKDASTVLLTLEDVYKGRSWDRSSPSTRGPPASAPCYSAGEARSSRSPRGRYARSIRVRGWWSTIPPRSGRPAGRPSARRCPAVRMERTR